MMRELELNEEPEFYFDLVPWQSLASINHNFLLTERRRHYLRYAGGLTFFEVCCLSIVPARSHLEVQSHDGTTLVIAAACTTAPPTHCKPCWLSQAAHDVCYGSLCNTVTLTPASCCTH